MITALKIKETIASLGIPATYLGHRYLAASIQLAIEDEDNLLLLTKYIYLVVADEFQTNKDCVERDLRTAINVLWERIAISWTKSPDFICNINQAQAN